MHSEQEIIEGFRQGNDYFFQTYFYEYCRLAYNIYDQRYGLKGKENLDFMSLAHQYAQYLIEHDWRPLEDHSPQISLRTWMVNGFRYIVLDALKWYKKEYGSITFDEYLRSFDTSGDLRLQFNRIVNEMCDQCLTEKEAELVRLLLVEGYQTREVAMMKGITPSAVSQQYRNLRERVLDPYLRKHFDMELDMPEVMEASMESCPEMMAPSADMESESCHIIHEGFGHFIREDEGLTMHEDESHIKHEDEGHTIDQPKHSHRPFRRWINLFKSLNYGQFWKRWFQHS